MPSEHAYGRIPDLADIRDYMATPPIFAGPLPDSVDLESSPFMPPVWSQSSLGACTAEGADAVVMFEMAKQGLPTFEPSHLFQYWNTRSLEGTTRSDAGASIRDAIKAAGKWGTAPATDWPYDIKKFAQKPPKTAYLDAVKHKALTYQAVPQTMDAIRAMLAGQQPIDFGITVYASFESAAADKTGDIPMPHRGEQVLGGHSIVMVGYDAQYVKFRNSWDVTWGSRGFGRLPWAYVLNPKLASDLWVVTMEQAA